MGRDLDLLQGSWTVTALEVEGQGMPSAMLANSRIVIKGSRFTSTGMGAVYEGTLEIDASTRPRQLTMKFDAGPEKGATNPGIYELDGDTWKICLATRGAGCPSSFASTPGSGFACETLTRGDSPVARKAKAWRRPKNCICASLFRESGTRLRQFLLTPALPWVLLRFRSSRPKLYKNKGLS